MNTKLPSAAKFPLLYWMQMSGLCSKQENLWRNQEDNPGEVGHKDSGYHWKVPDSPAAVNLCEEVEVGEELSINYTYTDMGRQVMILDIGAPVSITGVSWMKLYLKDFDL